MRRALFMLVFGLVLGTGFGYLLGTSLGPKPTPYSPDEIVTLRSFREQILGDGPVPQPDTTRPETTQPGAAPAPVPPDSD